MTNLPNSNIVVPMPAVDSTLMKGHIKKNDLAWYLVFNVNVFI